MRAPTKLKPQARTLLAPSKVVGRTVSQLSPISDKNNQGALTLSQLESHLVSGELRVAAAAQPVEASA